MATFILQFTINNNYTIVNPNYDIIFYNNYIIENGITIILLDQDVEQLAPLDLASIDVINVDFKNDNKNNEARIIKKINELNKKTDNENSTYFLCYGKNQ